MENHYRREGRWSVFGYNRPSSLTKSQQAPVFGGLGNKWPIAGPQPGKHVPLQCGTPTRRAPGESPSWSVGEKQLAGIFFKAFIPLNIPFNASALTSGLFQPQSPPDLKKGQPGSPWDHPSEGAQRKGPGMASTRSLPTSPGLELGHQVSLAG